FVDHLQQDKAGLAARGLLLLHQRLVYQRSQRVEEVRRKAFAADGLDGFQRTAAAKNRQTGEEALFTLVQQIGAPFDRVAQRALAGWSVACAGREGVERRVIAHAGQPLQQGLRGEELAASRGQLERQG